MRLIVTETTKVIGYSIGDFTGEELETLYHYCRKNGYKAYDEKEKILLNRIQNAAYPMLPFGDKTL